jgi:hypothetical protein
MLPALFEQLHAVLKLAMAILGFTTYELKEFTKFLAAVFCCSMVAAVWLPVRSSKITIS